MKKSILLVGLLSWYSYMHGMQDNIPCARENVIERICRIVYGNVSTARIGNDNLSYVIIDCQTPEQQFYAKPVVSPSSPRSIIKTSSFNDSPTTVSGRKVSFTYPVVTAIAKGNGVIVGKF